MKTVGKIAMALLFCLLILFAPVISSSLGTYIDLPEARSTSVAMATIVTDRCFIRETQNPQSRILIEVNAGQEFEVVSGNEQTVCIKLNEDKWGYLAVEDILLSGASMIEKLFQSDPAENYMEIGETTRVSQSQEYLVEGVKDTTHTQELFDTETDCEVEEDASVTEPTVNLETEDSMQESTVPVHEEDEKTEPELVDIVHIEQEIAEEVIEPVSVELSVDEEMMCTLINQLRADKGVTSLAVSTQLVDVARVKTDDMIEHDYFSHTSPNYGSPQDMLRHFDITFYCMGENLGMNQSVEAAFEMFVESPQHLDNIQNPNFTHIGISIQHKDSKNMIVTLLFIDASK